MTPCGGEGLAIGVGQCRQFLPQIADEAAAPEIVPGHAGGPSATKWRNRRMGEIGRRPANVPAWL
jgi:hypothetical protein